MAEFDLLKYSPNQPLYFYNQISNATYVQLLTNLNYSKRPKYVNLQTGCSEQNEFSISCYNIQNTEHQIAFNQFIEKSKSHSPKETKENEIFCLNYQAIYNFMNKTSGQIKVILGPMFSGKTSELMRLVRRFRVAEQKCLIINYANDTRCNDDDVIKTHDQEFLKAVQVVDLQTIQAECEKYDVVAIDEGQFFPDIPAFCEELANQGKIVIVAALDGTFERKKFNSILELIPLCEEVKKLNAICWFCKRETAAFTRRISESKEIELIGGKEFYRPSCRNCFLIKLSDLEKNTISE